MPGVGWRDSSADEITRRSIYIHTKRSLAVPFLNAFDAADPDSSCPVRFTTTQPTQALAMLNSDFLNDQAKVFAAGMVLRVALAAVEIFGGSGIMKGTRVEKLCRDAITLPHSSGMPTILKLKLGQILAQGGAAHEQTGPIQVD